MVFLYTKQMSLQELHIQTKQLSVVERLELMRLLAEELKLDVANTASDKTNNDLSWYGIASSDVTDLSLRDEELLFERD
jgi:hypothetical protein